MITIFTPTYNRAHTLPRLYRSIQHQSLMNFEWLIIDDGSTDNTENIILKWQKEAQFSIRYYKQENGGKHRATNYASRLARGDLFFIVDSDDYIPYNAVELLEHYYASIKNDNSFCGVAGSKCYPNGQRVGGEVSYQVLDTDVVTYRQTLNIKGDMAEVWKPSVLREYPFPEIPGEKFVTEAIVWNEIAKKYKLRYFNKEIYTCEYLDDGLTKNIRRHHRNSPRGTMLYYISLMKDSRFSLIKHITAAISYWRYTIRYKGKRLSPPFWAYFLFPLGYFFYLNDIKTER